MEINLNEEPLNDIEERIRRLEGVIFRARQRQRWRQNHTPNQITNFAGELITTTNVQDGGRVRQEEVGIDAEVGTADYGRIGKRKATYLIANALKAETYTNKAQGCGGNFFDCNICLGMARDPVLTCCGHLFCWPCFSQLSYAYLEAKECPVCKGEVTETGITPIYGNGDANNSIQLELEATGFRVPSRPHARRVESIRQYLRN
ncbi:putative transcription factor C2H2 family [Lupinus albus]|uniref:E3 ubiquitin-protein ligase RMA n=1 Tax=Lupinus albus TaxID=3870 RepID=A0A6A4NV20_LUPAL|nr:putative transcription factor C2H2 family [Lupinus albus]